MSDSSTTKNEYKVGELVIYDRAPRLPYTIVAVNHTSRDGTKYTINLGEYETHGGAPRNKVVDAEELTLPGPEQMSRREGLQGSEPTSGRFSNPMFRQTRASARKRKRHRRSRKGSTKHRTRRRPRSRSRSRSRKRSTKRRRRRRS